MSANLERFAPLARAISREFYLPGADRGDVEQEAMIALWIAARDYRPDRGMSFRNFAAFVIRRRLATAVKLANAQKHRHLNEAFSGEIVRDSETLDLFDALPAPASDPAVIVEAREEAHRLLRVVRDLSPLERRALLHVVNGHAYAGDKQIDNALQRARRKLADPTEAAIAA